MDRLSSDNASLFNRGNCWATTRADRFGWLIDGENYFRAFRDSIEAAEREILIVGWDIDSAVKLVREEDDPYYPSPLASTLEDLVKRKESLRVYVLSWDFAFLYMLERELLPAYRFGWQGSERLHFQLDGKHAAGASHHQKFVVIDGGLAYIGGFDLTKCRWDSREHLPDDPRRIGTDGTAYRPFHDVQAIVSGEPAARLRHLGALRWHNATGESLPEPDGDSSAAGRRTWPRNVAVHGSGLLTGLSRTWVSPDGSETIREIEQLYLDMIAAARQNIYIENQYFTSPALADALGRRLAESDGPEIVIVLPEQTSGWLEQITMEMRRNQLLGQLLEQDDHDRLRVVAPISDKLDAPANVHAKVMIVDDTWCRIGSANLSCRSMGLDSECDIVIEDPDHKVAPALRADLIAEHVGAECNEILESIERQGLLATLLARETGHCRFEAIKVQDNSLQPVLKPLVQIADMEEPIQNTWRVALDGDMRTHDDDKDSRESRFGRIFSVVSSPAAGWGFLVLLALVLLGGAIWAAGKLDAGLDPLAILDTLRGYTAHPLVALAVIPAFVAGSLVIAPVTGMIALCALLFSPWVASLSAIAGTLAATAVNHYIGRHLGKAVSDRAPQSVYKRIRSLADSADAWSLAGLRLIPIAPFSIVNLLAGAAQVNLRNFLIGTLIGMGPGIIVICLSVDRARAAISGEAVFDPWIIAAIAVFGLALIVFRAWQRKGEK